MKIALVGPTYPFRGGIAHHTTLLCEALRQKHNVRFYTFSRQYPKWLFPGKTDKDTSSQLIIQEPAEPILDGLNPFSWHRVARRIANEHPDLVIIPWWTSFFAPAFCTIAAAARKKTNATVLFVCHNVIEHERRFYGTLPTRCALHKGHAFIVHSETDHQKLLELVPGALVTKAFLPVAHSFSRTSLRRDDAKRRIGIAGNVLLFFGFVRQYKGLRYLIESLPEVIKRANVTLLVVGEFWENRQDCEKLIRERDLERNLKIIDRYVPNEEVETYFVACDAVVLPYTGTSQSAIVQLAYEFARPVIATTAGGLPDVVEDGKTGYLVPPRNSHALAEAIVRFFTNTDRADLEDNCRTRARALSWDRLVEIIEQIHDEQVVRYESAQDKAAERAANRAKLEAEGDRYSSSGWEDKKFARALQPLDPFLREAHSPKKVLEIGCGGMGLTAELVKYGLNPIAIDLDETVLRNVSMKRMPETRLVAADAEQLPFRDGIFDVVVHNQTLHHFPELGGVLREIRRVLKPGGKLCSIETNGWNPYVRYIHGVPWQRSKRHVSPNQRVFGLKKFIRELEHAGFEPIHKKMINFDFIKLLSPFDDLFGRIPLFNLIFAGSMVVCSEKQTGDSKHRPANEASKTKRDEVLS